MRVCPIVIHSSPSKTPIKYCSILLQNGLTDKHLVVHVSSAYQQLLSTIIINYAIQSNTSMPCRAYILICTQFNPQTPHILVRFSRPCSSLSSSYSSFKLTSSPGRITMQSSSSSSSDSVMFIPISVVPESLRM